MSAYSCTARAWSSRQSSAITSSQVSAPVTHGLVSTQRMPRPGTTKSSQREVDQVDAGLPADGATEDGVVPVHRERRLVQEQVAVLAQRVAEPTARELPLGLRLVHQVGERHPGAQRLVDARRAGEQGIAVDPRRPVVVPLLRPRDATEGQLHRRPRSPARVVRRATSARRRPGRAAASSGARRPTARYADMLVSPLASSTSPPDRLHRPRAVVALAHAGTSRTPPPRPPPRRPPSAPSQPRRGSRRRRARRPSRDGAVGLLHRDDRRRGLGDLRAA